MKELFQHHPHDSAPDFGRAEEVLCLPFVDRQKARQRAQTRSGQEVAIKLPRGTVLRGGDLLSDGANFAVVVEASPEALSCVESADPQQLARAAYHLGNRHVWVQVGDNFLSYLHDHVLDDMLRGLGISVTQKEAPFEPEAGAYSGGHHHEHEHDDTQSSQHSSAASRARIHTHESLAGSDSGTEE